MLSFTIKNKMDFFFLHIKYYNILLLFYSSTSKREGVSALVVLLIRLLLFIKTNKNVSKGYRRGGYVLCSELLDDHIVPFVS